MPLAKGFEIVAGRWALWVAAAIFGGGVSAFCYSAFRGVPATYPDFIVGLLSLSAEGKFNEYAMFLGFSLGSAGFFIALAYLFGRLYERAGAATVEEVYLRYIVAAIPAAAWLGASLLSRSENLGLFWSSAYFVAAATGGLLLAARTSNALGAPAAPQLTRDILDGMMLAPVAAALAVFAIGMVGNRLGSLFAEPWFKNPAPLYWAAAAAAAAAAGAVITIVLRAPESARLNWLRSALLLLQVFLPALFLALLPLPTTLDEHSGYSDQIRPATWILLALLTALAWTDLVRLSRRRNADLASSISVFSLIAVLVYCRLTNVGTVHSVEDDYHTGEFLTPWWSWAKFGLLPFWDFAPARGLINYKMGFFASLFTDGSAGGLLRTEPYQFITTIFFTFVPLSLVIGKWRAFLVLSFATLDDQLGDIDLLMTAGLCGLAYAWNRCTNTQWLMAWLAIGTLLVLIAPGQGGLVVLATAPAGVWRLYRAVRGERAVLLRTAAAAAVVFAVLGLATPLGHIVAGAVRYGAEQGGVNSIANAIPWAASFGSFPNIHPWLFEILRFGWLAVGGVAIVVTVWAFVMPEHPRRDAVAFLGVAISILCTLYVFRSGGRIDATTVGRPGWTTIWSFAFLLPLLLTAFLRGSRQLSALAATAAATAALSTQFWMIGVDAALQRPFLTQPILPLTDGAKIGIPNLGAVVISPAHADRLATIKRNLDQLLKPDETYLDMTNRGAHYFYFDRRPPSEVGAFYNMITPRQQMRVVKTLEAQRVPVALTEAQNILADGLKASARAPLVYRHLLLNFVPVTLDGYDFMVRPDRLDRLNLPATDPAAPSAAALEILDRDFLMSSLGRTPTAWGQSAGTLKKRVRQVVGFNTSEALAHEGVEQDRDGTYRVTGANPAIILDVARAKIRGRDAGLLLFDFVCLGSRAKPAVVLTWTAAGASADPRATVRVPTVRDTTIVPLDEAPRWLLAGTLDQLRIELAEPDRCPAFTLKNISLAQWTDVDEMEDYLRRSGNL